MSAQGTNWQIGTSDAPFPPLVASENADRKLKFYVEQYEKYGPIFRVPRPDKPLTVLAGPEANVFMARVGDEVLNEKQFWQDFDQEYSGQEVGREGQANRMRRAMVSHGYSRGRILERIPDLVTMTRQYAQSWEPGQRIDFYAWVQGLVAEQLGQLLTHTGTGDAVTDLDTFLSTTIDATMTRSQAKAALQSPMYRQAKERVFAFGRSIVAAHRLSSPGEARSQDLVDDMLQLVKAAQAAQKGQPGRQGLPGQKDRAQVPDERLALGALGPFLAGLHTVSSASCFLLYALLKNPVALQRVMNEVDTVLGRERKALSWERLKTMHALHGAAMEALRLYPVSTGHNCQASQPFTFAGYRVEQNEDVFVAMVVPHFLPELFPEPFTFDIDRYFEPRNEQRQRGAYAPFGLGEHSCLGAGIAEVQLMVTIATILFGYQLALDPPDYVLRPLEVSRVMLKNNFYVRDIANRDVQLITERV